ncbi:MAG: DsrE/DsrF/DrsH-like family protein [Gammaproteobacteria bacterium]|nr:DsrE/DsrF/DrsH-like family protein [Gammaproteobacteria bacterium]
MAITKSEVEEKLADLPTGMNPAQMNQWFDQRFEEKMREIEENHIPSLSIVVTKGTMDWGYPPFILASTAAALGWEVDLFFTFYGLQLLKKELNDLAVSPMGNPAMPMKMPFGPQWFQDINWNIPNIVMGNVPGFENLATSLMKKTTRNKGVASVQELRDICVESGVRMVACQMTVDLFGFKQDEFIPEIADWIGATTFLPIAQKSDVSLFI